MQLSDEEIYRNVAIEIAENTGKRVVIIQDRSIIDIAAYIMKGTEIFTERDEEGE